MVIECHGRQHYIKTAFGGISLEEAESKLLTQKSRDIDKADAAVQVGWAYIEIPYFMAKEVTAAWLLEMYLTAIKDSPHNETYDSVPPDDSRAERLEKARIYRHENYLKQKEKKNVSNNGSPR
jgi:hypothetical protein